MRGRLRPWMTLLSGGLPLAGAGCEKQEVPGSLPALCRDDLVDETEVCDDGNREDGDGCSADCTSDETCGSGVIDTAVGEESDDQNDFEDDGCYGS